MPEFIDPVFTKTSSKRSFSLNRKRAFWPVFAKTGSIISGTGEKFKLGNNPKAKISWQCPFSLTLPLENLVGVSLWRVCADAFLKTCWCKSKVKFCLLRWNYLIILKILSLNSYTSALHWKFGSWECIQNAACGPENLFRKPALWSKKQEQKFTNVREEKKLDRKYDAVFSKKQAKTLN